MHIFYAPDIEPAHKEHILSEEESGHACRVLRLREGDQIELLNGRGTRFLCTIADPHPKKCRVNVEQIIQDKLPSRIVHIVIAPTKNMDRMEWFAEKATEMGITHFSLIECRNSERKQVKTERLEKVLVSAMKQSKRSVLPILAPLTSFKNFILQHKDGYIAHCQEGEKAFLFETADKSGPILIGPEGDFTSDEVEFAVKNGYTPVHLGSNRLRTETAGLFACMQMAMKSDLKNE